MPVGCAGCAYETNVCAAKDVNSHPLPRITLRLNPCPMSTTLHQVGWHHEGGSQKPHAANAAGPRVSRPRYPVPVLELPRRPSPTLQLHSSFSFFGPCPPLGSYHTGRGAVGGLRMYLSELSLPYIRWRLCCVCVCVFGCARCDAHVRAEVPCRDIDGRCADAT